MDETRVSFAADSEIGQALLQWHAGLQETPGDRAELRRTHVPADATLSRAFHVLALRLPPAFDRRRLPRIATLVARVKAHEPRKTVAAACKGVLSEGRFRRLIESRDRDDLHNQLRSAIDLLDGRANLLDLAESLYYWGDNRRRQWATDYYTGGRE